MTKLFCQAQPYPQFILSCFLLLHFGLELDFMSIFPYNPTTLPPVNANIDKTSPIVLFSVSCCSQLLHSD